MRRHTLPAFGAAALLIASVAWPEPGLAQSASFEPLRSTGGRFQVIGGGDATRERPLKPVALTAPQASPPLPLPRPAAAAPQASGLRSGSCSTLACAPAPARDPLPAPEAASPPPAFPVAATAALPADLLAAISEPLPEPAAPPVDPIVTAAIPASPATPAPTLRRR